MCYASFCFGLRLYVRAIAVTVDSSTPLSQDITTKFVLGMTLREFLDHMGNTYEANHDECGRRPPYEWRVIR